MRRDLSVHILFSTSKLEKTCCEAKARVKAYGPECGKMLGRRLDDMKAATTLAVLGALPQAKAHELAGDRRGQLAVSLKHPQRLIFEPANSPVPTKSDGGLDWERVTTIRILEVVDYHG